MRLFLDEGGWSGFEQAMEFYHANTEEINFVMVKYKTWAEETDGCGLGLKLFLVKTIAFPTPHTNASPRSLEHAGYRYDVEQILPDHCAGFWGPSTTW